MPGRKTTKPGSEDAQADRERELRNLIEQVEAEKLGTEPSKKESPHDFVERRMRIKRRPEDTH